MAVRFSIITPCCLHPSKQAAWRFFSQKYKQKERHAMLPIPILTNSPTQSHRQLLPGSIYRTPWAKTKYLYLGDLSIAATHRKSDSEHPVTYHIQLNDGYIRYTHKLKDILKYTKSPNTMLLSILTAYPCKPNHILPSDIHGDFQKHHMPIYFDSITTSSRPQETSITITNKNGTTKYDIRPNPDRKKAFLCN